MAARLADTVAAELAQSAWAGLDSPGVISRSGIRAALSRTFGEGVTLEAVQEYAQPALRTLADADTRFALEARLVGVIAAALIFGAKLQETNGT